MLDNQQISFYKKLRDKEGLESNLEISPIPWNDKNKRVVNITTLADNFKKIVGNNSVFTSAKFALEMIEGVEKVRFSTLQK